METAAQEGMKPYCYMLLEGQEVTLRSILMQSLLRLLLKGRYSSPCHCWRRGTEQITCLQKILDEGND